MRKMFIIAAVAFAAISCCGNCGEKKCAEKKCCEKNCCEKKCCQDSAACCQHADSAAVEFEQEAAL